MHTHTHANYENKTAHKMVKIYYFSHASKWKRQIHFPGKKEENRNPLDSTVSGQWLFRNRQRESQVHAPAVLSEHRVNKQGANHAAYQYYLKHSIPCMGKQYPILIQKARKGERKNKN